MTITTHHGDCAALLPTLPPRSVQCCVTSPPYFGLRRYAGVTATAWPEIEYTPMPGLPPVVIPAMVCCLGDESDPLAYVGHLVHVFRLVRDVLRDDGTVWLNLGDSYARDGSDQYGVGRNAQVRNQALGRCRRGHKPPVGLKHKDSMLIPSRVALALQADGWLLRNDVIWHKPNPMPASVRDRLTVSHEHIFLLAKRQRYYYDAQAIEEPGIEGATRNARDVWRIPTRPYSGAHFAVFPEELPRRCILAGSSPQACEQCGAPWQRTIVRSRATHTQQPDPTRETGRQGFNRHRPGPSDHYVLGIPQPELAQRLQHAAQGREAEMEERFGSKWAHWLRTDASGARIPTAADADELETLLGISIPFDGKAGEWQSTCRCENEGTGRSVVLDPFVGSGTTLRVAERLGRDSIGIELGDYEHLQQERTAVIQREMEIA